MSRRRLARTRYESERTAQRARARRHYASVRQQREPRGRRRLLGIMTFAAAFGLGLTAGSADTTFWLALFGDGEQHVEHITVLGHARIGAEAIAASTGVEPGTAPADVDLASVAERVRRHPWVRAARVHRAQGGLLVVVEERSPAALLQASDDGSWRAVEADGTPFAEIEPALHPELPRLVGAAHYANGEPQPDVTEALALARRIVAHGIPSPATIALPAADGDPQLQALGWRFTLAEGGPEVVLGREPGTGRLTRLAELLAAQPAAVRAAERIDLRFRDRAILSAVRAISAEGAPASHDATTGTLTARLEERRASG